MQEIFDTGLKLLPRSSVVNIMRMALRAIANACMRTFAPDGVKAFNMYAIEKLAHNLLTIERFAGRCATVLTNGCLQTAAGKSVRLPSAAASAASEVVTV